MVPTNTTGSMTGQQTVVGTFQTASQAETALSLLREAGLTGDQVSVVAKDTRAGRAVTENTDMAGREVAGVASGALLGGLGGGALGWLVGISALVIPGIGPIVGAGVLAATIGGAVAGAVGGGIGGALINAGVPEEAAKSYETRVGAGGYLVSAQVVDQRQAEAARDIFTSAGSTDTDIYGSSRA